MALEDGQSIAELSENSMIMKNIHLSQFRLVYCIALNINL